MGVFHTLDRHAGLMNRMADTIGANLGDALVHGDLTALELRSAIVRCTGCEGAGECGQWLDAHEGGAAATPSYCRNQELLDRLIR